MRDRINPQYDYAEALSGPVPQYLDYIERQTYLKTTAPQMLCGRLQGRVLSLLSRLLRPQRILEIGTFTGYATLCLAEGLEAGGGIDTIEGDAEIAARARRHFTASPYAGRIALHVGQAARVLEDLPGPYDLIFMDGDKRGYPDYLPGLTDRLRAGGLLIADNVLWDGKAGGKTRDATANSLRAYNQLIADSPHFEAVILPLRDGLSISRKKE